MVCRRSEIAHPCGWLRTVTAPLPVVSVGNLTFGGTGKTPVVQALAQYCRRRGYRVAILLRGYRRRSSGLIIVSRGAGPEVPWWESGDEAWLHAWKIPEALVIVDRRRERAARVAHQLGAQVALLDDGFQYRRLQRALDLVLLDRRTLRCRFPLPFGCLREPLRALRRADFLLLSDVTVEALPSWLRSYPWVEVRFHFGTPVVWTSDGAQPTTPPAEPVAAFAGIARAERFRRSLQHEGWQIALWKPFPDHHPYSLRTLRRLLRTCLRLGIHRLVTTEKDLVRLMPLLEEFQRWGVEVMSVPLTASFGAGAARLWHRLDGLLQQHGGSAEDIPQHLKG